jgi:phosphatidylserine/phosphatidylglycerophosphate/cardiolipin synthase-like enzyme
MDRRLFLKRGAASLSAPAVLALAPPAIAAECTDVEVDFSPHGGAEALVLKTIAGARRSIRLLAYSFTSPSVVRALLTAKKSGVDVAVTVDSKNNVEEDRSGKARAALSALTYAGIPVRVVSAFPLQHSSSWCSTANRSKREVSVGKLPFTTPRTSWYSAAARIWRRPI